MLGSAFLFGLVARRRLELDLPHVMAGVAEAIGALVGLDCVADLVEVAAPDTGRTGRMKQGGGSALRWGRDRNHGKSVSGTGNRAMTKACEVHKLPHHARPWDVRESLAEACPKRLARLVRLALMGARRGSCSGCAGTTSQPPKSLSWRPRTVGPAGFPSAQR